MKILSAEQMRSADAFTISNASVSSIDLMERAGKTCFDWIRKNTDNSKRHVIICGTGNNGGDGLVIARLLAESKFSVEVIILSSPNETTDFKTNLERIESTSLRIHRLNEGERLSLDNESVIVDAIFGTGLRREVSGWLAECIQSINECGSKIISIDLPSGLFADCHSTGAIVRASHTLTFQNPKLAFFMAENAEFIGEFHVLEIGLDEKFIDSIDSKKYFIEESTVRNFLKPRRKFSHKGLYGHSLLISGSMGKMGAAVLAARSCLRTGTGLLTVHIPKCGNDVLQTSVPEAMVELDSSEDFISNHGELENYDAIGIGPGIGKSAETKEMLAKLLGKVKSPMVIDADALNILSDNQELISKIPGNSILTPHPKEFERLAGKSANDFDRHERQIRFSKEKKLIVTLKGAHTCVSLPDGRVFFNSTGNPGMSKGGSGDALTGMILSLLSQHYVPEQAALLGVYLHGLAGDIAAKKKGIYSMITSDLIESIPKAFRRLLDGKGANNL